MEVEEGIEAGVVSGRKEEIGKEGKRDEPRSSVSRLISSSLPLRRMRKALAPEERKGRSKSQSLSGATTRREKPPNSLFLFVSLLFLFLASSLSSASELVLLPSLLMLITGVDELLTLLLLLLDEGGGEGER